MAPSTRLMQGMVCMIMQYNFPPHPTNELCEGYVFRNVCLPTGGAVPGTPHRPGRPLPPWDQVAPPGPGKTPLATGQTGPGTS